MTAVDEYQIEREFEHAKHPASVVSGPYGHPFHPMLVTVPIGAWIGSFVLDIGSHVVDDGGALARGAWWMIAIGVIGAIVAALFGLLDLLRLPRRSTVLRQAMVHMVLNLAVVVAFVASFFWRMDRGVGMETSGWQIALSAVTLAVLGASGWIGGQLSYRFGVRVARETDQSDAYR